MIVLYRRISPRRIKKEAKEAIPQLEKWFRDNPHRRTCNAQVWYGKAATIRRNHVREDVEKARDEVLKPNHD